jgi:GLPGLI family protein
MLYRQLLCFLHLLSVCHITIAQSVTKQVQGIAYFKFQDWGPRLPFQTALHFTQNGTWYSRHHTKEKLKTDEGTEFSYYSSEQDWYTLNDSLLIFRNADNYIVPLYSHSPKPVINWQITDETQQIAGYTARKALGKSLNEDAPDNPYGQAVAWFTTDVPLPYGPDGYGGLPGLIVRLEYTARKKSYKTTLERIEYKDVEEWQMPATAGKAEVTLDQVYNTWKLDEKWLKAKRKELKL